MTQQFSTSDEPVPARLCVFSASFLGEVKVTLYLPDGSSQPVPISPNAKRVQLLAYLAWQRGQPVSRRIIEKRVFRHGLPKGYATRKHLQDMFGAHTRLLRRDIREAKARLRAQRDELLLPPAYDPLTHTRGFWELSAAWLPTDLEVIKGYAQIIDNAGKQGRLASEVPDDVKAACDALIAAYPGDFLQEMIRVYPEEFHPLKTSWVRAPHTFYRDCYLKALWYAGEYEWQHWQARAREWQEHAERAIHYYWQYALAACQSSIDTKLAFARPGGPPEFSERVLMSERALRRCLVLYQARGQRDAFEACYQEYREHMTQLSEHRWQPGRETLQVVRSARW